MKLFSNFSFHSHGRFGRRNLPCELVDDAPVVLCGNGPIDVVLSPKYYWVKIETLPVRFAYQAKAYAASVFEGIIPEDVYSYAVKKEGDSFCFFAYNDAEILNQLNQLGLPSSLVRHVYFAQNTLANRAVPIALSKTHALITHQGIVIKVPLEMVSESEAFGQIYPTLALPSFRIHLNRLNQVIAPKKIYTLALFIFILTLAFGVQYFHLLHAYKAQEKALEALKKSHQLPATNMQLEALFNRANSIDVAQKKLRTALHHAFKTPLDKGEFIAHLHAKSNSIAIKAKLNTPARKEVLNAYFEKHFRIDAMHMNGTMLEAELHYE